MKLNTKNEVHMLMYATIPSAATWATIETGLLWQLAAHPMRAEEIIQALKIPGKRGYYWLQLLEEIGILDNNQDGYTPSALAREAILEHHSQESWQHLAVDERERTGGVQNLPLYIQEPGSIWKAQGLPEPQDYVDKMRADPRRASEFTRMLLEVHQVLATQVAAVLDLDGARRMMDVGGGSGVVSMALLRKYPQLTSTVVDIPNVCLAGREIAAEQGMSNRLSYLPVEFAVDEFPAGFDAVLQCDVGVFGADLIRKIWRSLNPGGKAVFVELFSEYENSAPTNRVAWTLVDSLRDPHFSFSSIARAERLLLEAGFEVTPDHATIASGWVMVQARKVGQP